MAEKFVKSVANCCQNFETMSRLSPLGTPKNPNLFGFFSPTFLSRTCQGTGARFLSLYPKAQRPKYRDWVPMCARTGPLMFVVVLF